MFEFDYELIPVKSHRYYVFATGTKFKARYFETREAANEAMYEYCARHNINVECREYDKHERVYTNHNGVRFYINRVVSF